jgi:hypothetical protein
MKAVFNMAGQCIFLMLKQLIPHLYRILEFLYTHIKDSIQPHDYKYMGCGAISFGTYLSTFRVNLLLLSKSQNFMLLITS